MENKYYGLNCVFPKFHVEALSLNVTALGGRALKEIIKVKRGHKSGSLIQYDWCLIKRGTHLECTLTEKRPHEDTMRSQLFTSQKEASGETKL